MADTKPSTRDMALTELLKRKKLSTSQLAEVTQRLTGQDKSFMDYVKKAIGDAESLLSVGTGLYGMVEGGYMGIARALSGDMKGASDIASKIPQMRTYQPRTEAGKESLKGLSQGMETAGNYAGAMMSPFVQGYSTLGQLAAGAPLDEAVDYGKQQQQGVFEKGCGQQVSDEVFDKTGSPLAATGTRVLTEALPDLMGFSAAKPALRGIGKQYQMGDIKPDTNAIDPKMLNTKQQGSFGGIKAKNADLVALQKAKDMEAQGLDRNAIWAGTGWFNDGGDWKFEIDDSTSSLNMMGFPEKGGKPIVDGKLSDALEHPRAYLNYPDAKDITTVMSSEAGSGSGVMVGGLDGFMGVRGGEDNFKSTAIHELNHAIDDFEGYAKGGSPSNVTQTDINDAFFDHPKIDLTSKHWAGTNPNDLDEFAITELSKAYGLPSQPNKQATLQALQHAIYERQAGEAWARATQKRLDWPQDKRAANLPHDSLDVPEDELIYKRGGLGGLAQSVTLPSGQLAGETKKGIHYSKS